MSKSEQISHMTNVMAKFVGYTGKVLPDDVTAKLEDLHKKETSKLADVIFMTMIENQRLAKELDRPSCQDTGVIQFLVECGANFPLIGELEALLREAVIKATVDSRCATTALRLLMNTIPAKTWVKARRRCSGRLSPILTSAAFIPIWLAAAVPCRGKAMVLMPGAGYEGVTRFVLDVMTSYGLNACPPLLVGVGVATSVETAALLSKKALMRPIGSHNEMNVRPRWKKCWKTVLTKLALGRRGCPVIPPLWA
ncbi:L(+)-tartrate dehydratase subunit alpha [Klebsiella michiganensis]|nr:L(+)-tartrate dehydratase subunit alpha [Klebsiella michiganensis]